MVLGVTKRNSVVRTYQTVAPIFVVGAPRSGTTLLYSMITSSPVLPCYQAESKVLECFARYRSFKKAPNRSRFLNDFVASRQFLRSGLEANALVRDAHRECRSYVDFLALFMKRVADAQGKSRWAEKTPNHTMHLQVLSRTFPRARFIHVVRDGRAVALSQRAARMTSSPSNDPFVQLIWGAKKWEYMICKARAVKLPSNRYCEIRYEDLITNQELVINYLQRFTEIPLDTELVSNSKVGALGSANSAFGSKGRGVSLSAVDRWKHELSKKEIEAVEYAVAPMLTRCGYELTSEPRENIPMWKTKIGSYLAPLMIKGKFGVKQHTPLGRWSETPLEMGLK